jgi:hypothetical protein
MIICDLNGRLKHMLGPQLAQAGPFVSGSRVELVLPVRNEYPHAERHLDLRFLSDCESIRFDPESIHVDEIKGRETIELRTSIEVLPGLDVSRPAQVWAEMLSESVGRLQTAKARMELVVTPKIALDLDGDEVVLSNEGDAKAMVTLRFDPMPRSSDGTALHATDERGDMKPFEMEPRTNLRFFVGPYVGRVVAKEVSGGDRVMLACDRAARRAPSLGAILELQREREDLGARHGDLRLFSLIVANESDVPACEVIFEMPMPEGLRFADDLFTVDDVKVLPQDVRVEHGVATILLGRIPPRRKIELRGGLLVTADRTFEADRIELDGYVRAKRTERVRVRESLAISHDLTLSPNSTYLDDIEEQDDGTLIARVTVTNVEPRDLEAVSLNVRVEGARVLKAIDHTVPTVESVLSVQPSIAKEPIARIPIGFVPKDTRRTIEIILAPTPTIEPETFVSIAVVLMADGLPFDLGVQRHRSSGRVDLSTSALRRKDKSPLRLGMPVALELQMHNAGTVPAYDVRVRLDLPDDVKVDLPYARDGRWFRFGDAPLPPGGGASCPVTLWIERPLAQHNLVVKAIVDARNCPPVELDPIEIDTPSSPMLELSPVMVRLSKAGQRDLLHVSVRVSNVGDGPAQGVIVSVPLDDHPLPRTTTIDDLPVNEDGHVSMLVDGVDLGTLQPGTYRDIGWLVAPGQDAYQAHVRVCDKSGTDLKARSSRTTLHVRSGFAADLPDARNIDPQRENLPQAEESLLFARATVERPQAPALESPTDDGSGCQALASAWPLSTEMEPGRQNGHLPLACGVASEPVVLHERSPVQLQSHQEPPSPPATDKQEPNEESAGISQDVIDLLAGKYGQKDEVSPPDEEVEQESDQDESVGVDDEGDVEEPEPTDDDNDYALFGLREHSSSARSSFTAEEPEEEETPLIRGAPNVGLLTAVLPVLADSGLQLWKHVVASRLLLPDDHPGYGAVEAGLSEIIGPLTQLREDARPDESFVRRMERMDAMVLEDVRSASHIYGDDCFGKLDVYLVRSLPDAAEGLDEASERAYSLYVEQLKAYWGDALSAEAWENEERRIWMSSKNVDMLDESLRALADALDGA